MDWFKHDINTQLDIKIRKLLRTEGYLGYGIYWHLVEALYKRGGRMEESEVKDELLLAGAEDILPTLLDVGLFSMEGSMVVSERIVEAFSEAEDKKKAWSEAGKKGSEIRWGKHSHPIATLSPPYSHPIASDSREDKIREENIRKESHINVSEEKSDLFSDTPKRKLFSKPSLEEVRAYVREKNYSFSPENFMAFYDSNGWKVGRVPMKDWKAACRTWQSREQQSSPSRKRIIEDTDQRQQFVNDDGSLRLL